MAQPGIYHVFALPVVGIIVGCVLFARGFRELGIQRLISNTPTAHVRSMAMGLVEITGKVEPRSLVTSPFSGTSCVYWQVEVAVRNRNSWRTVHHNASGNPFFLRDQTGLAMIYPAGADCRLEFGVSEECHGLSLPEPYSEYLADQHLGMRHLWQLETMRFRERVLEEGAQVFVLGTAIPKPEVHSIGEGDEFVKTGTDGDTWAERVRQRMQETSALVRQGENQKVFIISQQSERDFATQLGLIGWAHLVGGPLLAIVSLGILLAIPH